MVVIVKVLFWILKTKIIHRWKSWYLLFLYLKEINIFINVLMFCWSWYRKFVYWHFISRFMHSETATEVFYPCSDKLGPNCKVVSIKYYFSHRSQCVPEPRIQPLNLSLKLFQYKPVWLSILKAVYDPACLRLSPWNPIKKVKISYRKKNWNLSQTKRNFKHRSESLASCVFWNVWEE